MANVLPLNDARETSALPAPIDTKGVSSPLGTPEQDLDPSRSTCSEPWMNVRRSMTLTGPSWSGS